MAWPACHAKTGLSIEGSVAEVNLAAARDPAISKKFAAWR
jgi:hypothetical protein